MTMNCLPCDSMQDFGTDMSSFCCCCCRERDWNPSNSDQGPLGTDPEGDIEVSVL